MSEQNVPVEPRPLTAARQWLNRNAAMVLVLCVAAMGLSVVILRAAQKPDYATPTHEWFYDSVTGELVAQPVGTIPLTDTGGNELWRAHVYACGDCEGETFIGYYTRYTTEARERMERFRRARQRWVQADREDRHANELSEGEGNETRDLDGRRFEGGPRRGDGFPGGGRMYGGRFGDDGDFDEMDGMMQGLEFSTDGITWTRTSYEGLDEVHVELESRCPGHNLRQCLPPRAD